MDVARFTPPGELFEDRGRDVPELCIDREVGGLCVLVLLDEFFDGLFCMTGGADDLDHFLPHTELGEQRNQGLLLAFHLPPHPLDLIITTLAAGLGESHSIAQFLELANSELGRLVVVTGRRFGHGRVMDHARLAKDLGCVLVVPR